MVVSKQHFRHKGTNPGLGQHEPDNGEGLEGVVKGEPVENDLDERLDEVEEAENNPVIGCMNGM